MCHSFMIEGKKETETRYISTCVANYSYQHTYRINLLYLIFKGMFGRDTWKWIKVWEMKMNKNRWKKIKSKMI